MYIQQLRNFCSVVEQGAISKVAVMQHCSQPGLTKQLHSLEEELGQQLFYRNGKKLSLNNYGQIVYNHCIKLLAEIDAMQEELHQADQDYNKVVKFGATRVIGMHILPAKIATFKATNLHCVVFTTVNFLDSIIHLLETDQISFAFLPECPYLHTRKNLHVMPFMQDEMALVMSPKHPWAHRDSVDVHELENTPFSVSQPHSAARKYVEAALAAQGVTLRNVYDMYSIEIIKQALLQGNTVSILSQIAIRLELQYKILVKVPIKNFSCTRQLYIVYKEDRQLTRAEQQLIDSFL